MKIAARKTLQALAVMTPLALSACQEFKGVNALVGKSEGALAAAGAIPRMSIRQTQSMHDQLASKVSDRAVLHAREEARPTIEKILGIAGCCPESDLTRLLTPYSVPEPSSGVSAPMARMKYHPKSQCLSVLRVDGWSMPAQDALSFRAIFVSDLTLESSFVKYELVKQPDGAWLLR